jgi:hypothetical protein
MKRISQGQAMRTRYPNRAALRIAFRQFVGADQQLASPFPSLETTFQSLCLDAAVAQPGSSAFAKLLALLADNDDRLSAICGCPLLNGAVVPTYGAGQQPRINPIVVIDAYIDDGRCLRKADKTGELSDIWECGRDLSAVASRGRRE